MQDAETVLSDPGYLFPDQSPLSSVVSPWSFGSIVILGKME